MQQHKLTATLVGKGIKVTDEHGKEVKVQYGATIDRFTCYAYVDRIGFIGGWTCGIGKTPIKKKAPAFLHLIDMINQKMVYQSTSELPNSYGRPYKEQIHPR